MRVWLQNSWPVITWSHAARMVKDLFVRFMDVFGVIIDEVVVGGV